MIQTYTTSSSLLSSGTMFSGVFVSDEVGGTITVPAELDGGSMSVPDELEGGSITEPVEVEGDSISGPLELDGGSITDSEEDTLDEASLDSVDDGAFTGTTGSSDSDGKMASRNTSPKNTERTVFSILLQSLNFQSKKIPAGAKRKSISTINQVFV